MNISLSTTLRVIIPKRPTDLDILVLELSAYLAKKLKSKILRVERISGWDGSNVRIVVSDFECVYEVLEAVEEFERENNILGTIAPEVLTLEEYLFRGEDEDYYEVDDEALKNFREYLRRKLGNRILRVERISGWDGSNVRIVVSDFECVYEVLEAVEEFERENNILGTIAPEVVIRDEI